MPTRRTTRRALVAVGAVVVVAGSFTSGVVAGAGSAGRAAAPASPTGVLDEAAQRIEDTALHPVDRTALDAAAVQAMLRASGDPWGQWQAAPGPAARAYAGVGLWLRGGPEAPVVARVTSGSPAEQAGVRVGDELRSVGGRAARGAAATDAASWLRGAPDTAVDVVLARGSALRTVRLRRADLPPLQVGVRTLDASAGSVAVVTVPSFERGTGRQVRDAVAALPKGAAGVVLDLRGNGGGLLDEAVETASAFLPGGPVVRCTRRDGTTQQLDAEGSGDTGVSLAVLVDGGSASAAEIVAGALQDRGRAVLVGSRTYGKGSVQEPGRLSDGSSLELTVASWTTPAGRTVDGVGIEPDIDVAPAGDPALALQRAVDVLPGLRADGTGARG